MVWTALRATMNLPPPFRNIINEWYAKEASKKIRAVIKVKETAGENLTSNPSYGYMKSLDDPKALD